MNPNVLTHFVDPNIGRETFPRFLGIHRFHHQCHIHIHDITTRKGIIGGFLKSIDPIFLDGQPRFLCGGPTRVLEVANDLPRVGVLQRQDVVPTCQRSDTMNGAFDFSIVGDIRPDKILCRGVFLKFGFARRTIL